MNCALPRQLLRPDWLAMGLLLSLAACSSPTPPGTPAAPAAVADAGADSIYFGGNIITVNDAQPSAEAVAVKDGKIVAVGTRAEIEAGRKGASTKMVDLAGKTMSPSFIDAHSHFINSLTLADQANCSAPPVGIASDVAGIIAQLQKFRDERKIPAGELIMGYGYDENLMPKGTALDRTSLDAAFPDNPVMVVHVSLHGAVLNGAAMKKYGLSAETKTPPGGIILRMPGSSEPSGLVMETAFLPIFARLPTPTPEQEIELLRKGQAIYAAAGVTTAQEGATHAPQVASLKRGAQAGALFIDVVAYPFITDLDAVLADNPASSFGQYHDRFKLGGVKITVDGSPQGKTAFFTTPYLTGGPAGEKNWRGEPTFPQADLDAMFSKVYGLNLPLLVHGNGDGAIDMILEAHAKAAEGSLDRDRRTTVIHSQFVRKDQLQKYVDYRMIPSFYTEHTFFFSGAHLLNRGKEQTYFTSPMKTAISMGLKPTNHTDFSVLPMDQMLVMWSAVNRVARDGEVIGPDERITPLEALKAITINAAYQYFEEGSKGSIEVGKLADLVILDQDPLTVDPMKIKDIQVLETFKEGKSIYRRQAD